LAKSAVNINCIAFPFQESGKISIDWYLARQSHAKQLMGKIYFIIM